jgi:hypothetical protein
LKSLLTIPFDSSQSDLFPGQGAAATGQHVGWSKQGPANCAAILRPLAPWHGPNNQIIEPAIEKPVLAGYLETHCIPVNALYADDFAGFMKARQKLLMDWFRSLLAMSFPQAAKPPRKAKKPRHPWHTTVALNSSSPTNHALDRPPPKKTPPPPRLKSASGMPPISSAPIPASRRRNTPAPSSA